jgi:hypothetical protein
MASSPPAISLSSRTGGLLLVARRPPRMRGLGPGVRQDVFIVAIRG